MKRIYALLVIGLLALCMCAGVAAAESLDQTAGETLNLLVTGDYDKLCEAMAPELAAMLTTDMMKQTMDGIIATYGAPTGYTLKDTTTGDGTQTYVFAVMHGETGLEYYLSFDVEGKLSGLHMSLAEPEETPVPTTVPAVEGVRAESLTLRPGEVDETRAELMLPEADGVYPAAILMQGSGPSDMNESIMGVNVFYDIAVGLAKHGVASIRYDKYTYAHADLLAADVSRYASFTVEDEYVNDARAALALLKADPRIGDIYVVGHSQGALLMPRIISELNDPRIVGGVSLAGTPMHLWEVQYAQNIDMIAKLPEDSQASARATLDAEADKVELFDSWTDDELKTNTFFGAPAYYQKDECSIDPIETLIANDLPVLFIQAGKDWQVKPELGIELWQSALADYAKATYITYPELNHLLVPQVGEVTGTTADYAAGGTVSEQLISDLSGWILDK